MYMEIKEEVKKPDYENVVGQDSLTRFDKPKGNNNRNKNKRRKKVESPTINNMLIIDQIIKKINNYSCRNY